MAPIIAAALKALASGVASGAGQKIGSGLVGDGGDGQVNSFQAIYDRIGEMRGKNKMAETDKEAFKKKLIENPFQFNVYR